jgi:hypothetical protein
MSAPREPTLLCRESVDPQRLVEMIAQCATVAPHRAVLLRAVRDDGLATLDIVQSRVPFWPPKEGIRRPILVLIGDDLHTSKGPRAFHQRSLKRLFRDAAKAVIVSCASYPHFYELAVRACATFRRHVVLVECLPSTLDAWLDAMTRGGLSKRDMLVGVVRGEPFNGPAGNWCELPPMAPATTH